MGKVWPFSHISTNFLIFSYKARIKSKWEFIWKKEKKGLFKACLRLLDSRRCSRREKKSQANLESQYGDCLVEAFKSVPFDHREQNGLYRSSMLGEVPLLY